MGEILKGMLSKWGLILVAVGCIVLSVLCLSKSDGMFRTVNYEVKITNIQCHSDDEVNLKDVVDDENSGIETIKHEISGSAKNSGLALAGGIGSGVIAIGLIAFLIWRFIASRS